MNKIITFIKDAYAKNRGLTIVIGFIAVAIVLTCIEALFS